jgi:AraC-like DNA-binding protein
VAQLEKSEIYRDYRQAFEATTGLPLGLRTKGSFQSPLQGSKQINPFCALMAGMNKSCAACLRLQQRVEQEANGGPKTLECFAGLSESAVPVRVGENVVGYLQTGQIFLRKPSKLRFDRVLAQLKEWNVAVNRPALEKAYFGTRVLAGRHYDSALRLLAIFCQHLSSLSNQIVVRESLARAVNLSEFYFCKMFKKETGVTFVDYLARVRVETLKQLLLDPHKRVSEAAYEAGFQSLSQFNRVFRRIAGEAPSSYRDKLHRRLPTGAPRSAFAHAA